MQDPACLPCPAGDGERTAHGFRRTTCGCAVCAVPCRHNPGGLDVDDLHRLCPDGRDVFAWAEEHLRALTHKPYPVLVPARGPGGACHWHFGGRCAVHQVAPYGCAFFDAHMPPGEVERRYGAAAAARRADAAAGGLYTRVWRHLVRRGLTDRPGSTSAMAREAAGLRERAGG